MVGGKSCVTPKITGEMVFYMTFFTCDLPIYCVGCCGWIINHCKGATQNNLESRLEGETPDLSTVC